MPAFASVDGKLSSPKTEHPSDGKYLAVEIGKPLCVEILHWAFGDVKDFKGPAEILAASWARLGRASKPGPRLVQFIRKGIKPFDFVSDLGAAKWGHRLVFYSPAYDGEQLKLSVQLVELDKALKKNFDKISAAPLAVGALPIFAAQLPFILAIPNVLELGRRLHNLLNQNDIILAEPLDLRFKDDDFALLTSGRYVLVEGSHREDTFGNKYKLATDGEFKNRLVTQSGELAEKHGLNDAYVVFRVQGKEVPDYKDFQIESAAQQLVGDLLKSESITDELAELVSDAARAASEYGTVKQIMEKKSDLDNATKHIVAETDKQKSKEKQQEIQKLQKEIQNLLKLVSGTQGNLLTSTLNL